MITVTPQGQIYLCKTPLENDYKNQLTFDTLSSQLSYFNSTIQKTFDNYTYIKKDNMIKVGANIDEIINCNYLFYQNKGFTDKYYFCFITRMEYDNENCTKIFFETDSYQTYLFDINYKRCFIEREHVNSDALGEHTVPENLETGEYIINSVVDVYSGSNTGNVCIMCSDLPDEIKADTSIKFATYGGILSGCYMLIPNAETVALSVTNFCRAMDELAKADAIIGIFVIPSNLITSVTYSTYNIHIDGDHYITTSLGLLGSSNSATTLGTSSSITSPTSLNGYTPKNNKVRCYPYSYFYVTNNVGSNIDYHYEDFVNNSASFKTVGIVTPGCSIRTVPLNYKKLSDSNSMNSYNYGLAVGKYPICSWRSDLFINWLKENSYNLGLTIGGGLLATAGGIATGNLTATAGGAGTILTAIGQIYQHSLTPDQANGNTNTNDVTYSAGKIKATAYKMCVKSEYAKIIDDFFTMYGYKVNRVKTPNITGRPYWNYVKTIDCNFDGDIPETDLATIRSMFNNGVTLWHSATNMYDYSLNNTLS